MATESVFLKILEYSPIIAILGFMAFIFWKEIQKKDETIQTLNKEVREIFVQNVEVIKGTQTVIQSLKENSVEELKHVTTRLDKLETMLDEIRREIPART